MPCNSVAVVRVCLETRTLDEFLSSPPALTALTTWLGQQLNTPVTRTDAPDGVMFASDLSRISLSRRDGLLVTSFDPTFASKVETFTRDLASALAQERLVAALRSRAYIASDERAPSGHRVLTLAL